MVDLTPEALQNAHVDLGDISATVEALQFCSASGVRSTITVSLAVMGTQSGRVSRTVMR